MEGPGRHQLSLPATGPHSSARPLRTEVRQPLAPSSPPTAADNGLIPLSADPCSAAPGPTKLTSFPSRARLSSSMAASLLEREPPALRVSLSAIHARPSLTRLLYSCGKRSGFLLCSQACLGNRATQTNVLGVEGKGSLSWSATACLRTGTEPGWSLGSHRLWAASPWYGLAHGSGSSLFPQAPH